MTPSLGLDNDSHPLTPRNVITYLLAIGRRGPRRRYLTASSSWERGQPEARRFFDRVSMRVVQLEQARQQEQRVRVVRLRERV